MANVPAISDFIDAVNAATNPLLSVRDTLLAADRLWPSLDATSRTNLRTQMAADVAAAKALVAALVAP